MADQIPDSAKRDAIDILTTYVDFIRNEVRANDFERHPYVPHIEQTIEDLRAAPPATDREAVERVREAAYRQALEDVCNPLGYLQRMADAEGAKLSGMAYAIASDIGTIQRIAKEALSTLSADAIRQGEGVTEQEALQRAIDRMGWAEINAFHAELRRGQDIYEDAGGFFMRAIRALFGIKPTDPVTNYQDAARALVEAATPAVDAALEREVDCSICGGDCAGANPPVMNCPSLATPASHASDGGKA